MMLSQQIDIPFGLPFMPFHVKAMLYKIFIAGCCLVYEKVIYVVYNVRLHIHGSGFTLKLKRFGCVQDSLYLLISLNYSYNLD